MIFEREKEVKDVLFSQIKEAQKCLRADVSVAQNILGELLNLKSRTVALKQTFDRDLDQSGAIVGTVGLVNSIN